MQLTIVTCPDCGRQFRAGREFPSRPPCPCCAALARPPEGDEAHAAVMRCTGCNKRFRVPVEMEGAVRCPYCPEVFRRGSVPPPDNN